MINFLHVSFRSYYIFNHVTEFYVFVFNILAKSTFGWFLFSLHDIIKLPKR